MPNNPRAGGVSRRIEGEDRDEMREVMDAAGDPRRHGRIVRTAGIGRTPRNCSGTSTTCCSSGRPSRMRRGSEPAPFLIYQESEAGHPRAARLSAADIGEILIDEERLFRRRRSSCSASCRRTRRKLKLYTDDVPLFTRFQIESQIESAYATRCAALGRLHRDRLHRGAGLDRHQLGPRHQAAATSRKPRSTPTSRRRTRSRASCACATSAA
jgi:ribonuclease E